MKALNLSIRPVYKILGTFFNRSVPEVLPPVLTSTSQPPPLFDGTTRLYISYTCPFAQRAWIARNFKGLQDIIKLVAIDLESRPPWYKEKVYPENKVPALEHNGKITGESLDLVNYIDKNFEGPTLLPDDPEKQKFSDEMIEYSGTFMNTLIMSLKGVELDPIKEAAPAFEHLETALKKFSGPFFIGETISAVDIVYAPFIERFQGYFEHELKYDVTSERPNLAAWVEGMNKLDAYKQTKCDINHYIQYMKTRVLGQN